MNKDSQPEKALQTLLWKNLIGETLQSKSLTGHAAVNLTRRRVYTITVQLNLLVTQNGISVKARLTENHNIVVNFSDKHNFYISAYRYLCKQDNNVAHSQWHPNLAEAKSPRTKKSIESNWAASKKRRSSSACSVKTAPKKKRLTNSELSDFIKEHNFKNYLELLAIAQIRKEEGETDIHEYVLSHQEKYVKELIKKTWNMVEAPENLKQLNLTRMEELEAAAKTNCITG